MISNPTTSTRSPDKAKNIVKIQAPKLKAEPEATVTVTSGKEDLMPKHTTSVLLPCITIPNQVLSDLKKMSESTVKSATIRNATATTVSVTQMCSSNVTPCNSQTQSYFQHPIMSHVVSSTSYIKSDPQPSPYIKQNSSTPFNRNHNFSFKYNFGDGSLPSNIQLCPNYCSCCVPKSTAVFTDSNNTPFDKSVLSITARKRSSSMSIEMMNSRRYETMKRSKSSHEDFGCRSSRERDCYACRNMMQTKSSTQQPQQLQPQQRVPSTTRSGMRLRCRPLPSRSYSIEEGRSQSLCTDRRKSLPYPRQISHSEPLHFFSPWGNEAQQFQESEEESLRLMNDCRFRLDQDYMYGICNSPNNQSDLMDLSVEETVDFFLNMASPLSTENVAVESQDMEPIFDPHFWWSHTSSIAF